MVRVVLDHGISIHTLRHMDKLLLLRYVYSLLIAEVYLLFCINFFRLQLIQV